MTDEKKKSFWTSLPGILTGVAAIIVAITGMVAAYNNSLPMPSPEDPPNPPSTQQQWSCGEQLSDVTLIGSWRWSGSIDGDPISGTLSLKNDCTYTNIPRAGFEKSAISTEGQFMVSSSPPSITFKNEASGEDTTYLISNISENSFHASSADKTVNLDFFRAS